MIKQFLPIFLLATCFTTTALTTQAQTATTTEFSRFVRQLSEQGKSRDTYNILLQAYRQSAAALQGGSTSQTAEALKLMFPYLGDAAYYFTQINDANLALQAAEAYVDIPLLPPMSHAGIDVQSESYAQLAYFAASNNYNARRYDKAARYLDAYIRTNAAAHRKDAFAYLAKAYIALGRKADARQVYVSGLNLYPNDLSLLSGIINLLGESGEDDALLQSYTNKALALRPNDEGLLYIQASMYERTHAFASAASFYERLRTLKPNSKKAAEGVATNYYNAAVQCMQQEASTDRKANRRELAEQARAYLRKALPVLTDLLHNDPLAIHYALALAQGYAYLGDTNNLQAINAKLRALGRSEIAIAEGSIIPAMSDEKTYGQVALRAEANTHSAALPATQPTPNYSTSTPRSDVDSDLPRARHTADHTFAIIIANEDYERVAKVPCALADGKVFARYCEEVIGLPKDHIRTHYNTSFGKMLDAIEDIKAIGRAMKGDLHLIVYYAGHGVPDEATRKAYLLPTDADGRQLRACYALDDFYRELGLIGAKSTTVFLDACFSGSQRGEGMLASARGVSIKPKQAAATGNLVIFSATSADQTAFAYDDKGHGMFTYFLLKALKEKKGNIPLGKLTDYVSQQVALQSQLKNHKSQTPSLLLGPNATDSWKEHILGAE